MTVRRQVGVLASLLMACSTVAIPLLLPAPAAAAAPCVVPTNGSGNTEETPLFRRVLDHPRLTAKDLAAIDEVMTSPKSDLRARTAAPRLARTVTVPVRVHVIRGKHRGERFFASKRRIQRTMQVLNNAYAGKQSSLSHQLRYHFKLVGIDRTTRDGWYHAYSNGPRTQRMMRALHRGGKRTLNIYLNGAGTSSMPVLGFSRFPWQQASRPKLDGVVVNHRALPWGSFKNYNRGDTVVHEVGHWLGLLHTFQGGCQGGGDLVADTPAEAVPSFACPVGRDSCADRPGKDPVRNFMNYSQDACMREFTAGQALRADVAWTKWRQ